MQQKLVQKPQQQRRLQPKNQRQEQQDDSYRGSVEVGDTYDDAGFTVVTRRGGNKKQSNQAEGIPGENSGTVDEGKTQPKKKKDIAKALRKKPPAIIVRVNDGSYSEVLKKLKLNEQVKEISDGIVGLTKTRDGDLLVRLYSKTESLQLVEAIGTAMGDRSVVKELVHYQRVVVQDLDEQAEPEEIKYAICRQIGVEIEKVKVVSIREMSRGQKWAIVSLPAGVVSSVMSAGRLRVGYVNCRVRLWEDRGMGRCFRCLSRGHLAGQCKGADRSKCCRRCGIAGHRAAKCEATTELAKEFATKLDGVGQKRL